MRARRRRIRVVRVDNRIVKRGEDGKELGLDGGIVFSVAAFTVFIVLTILFWSRSSGGRSTGSRSGGCRLGWRFAFAAYAPGVVQVEILENADVAGRPDNFLLEARPPLTVTVRTSSLQELAVDHVEFVLDSFSLRAWSIGNAWLLHTRRAIAAGGAAAADAKESLVTSLEIMRSVNAMPRIAFGDIDGSEIVLVKKFRSRAGGKHGLADVNGCGRRCFIGESLLDPILYLPEGFRLCICEVKGAVLCNGISQLTFPRCLGRAHKPENRLGR